MELKQFWFLGGVHPLDSPSPYGDGDNSCSCLWFRDPVWRLREPVFCNVSPFFVMRHIFCSAPTPALNMLCNALMHYTKKWCITRNWYPIAPNWYPKPPVLKTVMSIDTHQAINWPTDCTHTHTHTCVCLYLGRGPVTYTCNVSRRRRKKSKERCAKILETVWRST